MAQRPPLPGGAVHHERILNIHTRSLGRINTRWLALVATLAVLWSLTACSRAPAADQDRADLQRLMEKYLDSIKTADTKLAAEVWSESPDLVAVTPLGRYQGWESVKENVYVNFLQKAFAERNLQTSNLEVHSTGSAAWAVFDWTFTAKLAGGQPFSSKGWESHVYQKTDKGWRIVHLHYSGMAPAAPIATLSGKPILVVRSFTAASDVVWPYDTKQLQGQTVAEFQVMLGKDFDVLAEAPPGPASKVYTLDVEVTSWNSGNAAKRVIVGLGSGRESADIRYRITDGSNQKVLERKDTIRTNYNSQGAGSTGTLAHPFAEKIAERIRNAKLK